VDASNGAAVAALNGHQKEIMYSEFSPDGKRILTVSRDATARIWDNSGKQLQVLKGHTALIFRGEFSPDGTKVVTASNDSTAKVWDVATGNMLMNLTGHKNQVWNAHFSHDGKNLVTASKDGTAILWDANNGKQLFTLDYKEGLVSDAIFNHNDSRVLLMGEFNEPVIYDANTGKGILILDGHKQHVYAAAFSHNGKLIYTGARDGTAGLWSTETGSFIKELKGHTNQINSVEFTKDDEQIVTSSQDRTAIVWSVASGEKISVFKGHTDFIRTATLGPDGKNVLTVSEDNTIKQWNLQKQSLDYTRVELDASDYLVYSPSGYYSGSPDAAKKIHYVTNDLNIISFDQLDIRYNRPDMVLSAFETKDTSLIRSYNNAWQKRVKKLGVDTMQFNGTYAAPVADIANRNDFNFEQSTNQLTIRIAASDSVALLQRYNIWLNDVPVFGMKGKQIDNKRQLSETQTITLSSGVNRIEVSVTNNNGTESFRKPLLVKFSPAKPVVEKVYFIGIGINQYANADYNLSWSVKDIRDMAIAFSKQYGNSIIIDTLFDKNVTKENILALKNKLLLLTENDKVIISYSGHGVLSKDLDYFLSTYNISFEQPAQFGLPYDELESLMDGIRPRKKLMLIDACHSGEVDKEEFGKIELAKAVIGSNGVTARSSIKIAPKKNLGMTNSFELMQNLFANVSRGTGATIISAAGAMQYAQERGDLKNGVFTYSILEAFNANKTLTVSQLKKIVGERVTSLTNGLQKPTSRNETINVDWNVW
jgi:WD40 repeat protein